MIRAAVVDASYALSWCFSDERTDQNEEYLEAVAQGAKIIVPPVWVWEINNALIRAVRHKRMTRAERAERIAFFDTACLVVDEDSLRLAWSATSALAEEHRLSLYDASYLELALRRGVPLATMDAALATIARKKGVTLVGSNSRI